jgi:hypothetical protein
MDNVDFGLLIAHEVGHNFRATHNVADQCWDSNQQGDTFRATGTNCNSGAPDPLGTMTCYDVMSGPPGVTGSAHMVPLFSDGIRNDQPLLKNNVRFIRCEAAYKSTGDSAWVACPAV